MNLTNIKLGDRLFKACQGAVKSSHGSKRGIVDNTVLYAVFSSNAENPFGILTRFAQSRSVTLEQPVTRELELENSYSTNEFYKRAKQKLLEARIKNPTDMQLYSLTALLSTGQDDYQDDFISYITQFSNDKTISSKAVDMTIQAREGRYDQVAESHDKHSEFYIQQIAESLHKDERPSVIIVAESGTGKTALVEKLACKIARDEIESLYDYRLIQIDIASILSGTRYRGDFEENFGRIVGALSELKLSIGFFDGIHMLVGAGKSSDSSIDAASLTTQYLSKGLKLIGVTTIDDFNMYIEKNQSFLRMFQVIYYSEPSIDDTVEILKSRYMKPSYGQSRTSISETNIRYATIKAIRHIKHSFNPDKSIQVVADSIEIARKKGYMCVPRKCIDDAIRKACNIAIPEEDLSLFIQSNTPSNVPHPLKTTPPNNNTTTKTAKSLSNRTKPTIAGVSEYDAPSNGIRPMPEGATAEERDDEDTIKGSTRKTNTKTAPKLKNVTNGQKTPLQKKSDNMDIDTSGSLPRDKLEEEQYEPLIPKARLATLSSYVNQYVKGQKQAVDDICAAIISSQLTREDDKNGPFLSMLISGLSGTGKTLLCRKIAQHLLGHQECFLPLNMGDYNNPSTLESLISSTSNQNKGKLSSHIKRYPYSIILLDEFEKCHLSIQDYFLSVFDTGMSYDNAGKKLHFYTTIFILTTNIGADDFISKYSDDLSIYRKSFIPMRRISIETVQKTPQVLPSSNPFSNARNSVPIINTASFSPGFVPTNTNSLFTSTNTLGSATDSFSSNAPAFFSNMNSANNIPFTTGVSLFPTNMNNYTNLSNANGASPPIDQMHGSRAVNDDTSPIKKRKRSPQGEGADDVPPSVEELQSKLEKCTMGGSSMRLEMVGRINRIITYGIPDNQSVFDVIKESVSSLCELIKKRYTNITILQEDPDACYLYILHNGYSDKEGVRSIQRFIGKKIEDGISKLLVSGDGPLSINITRDCNVDLIQ